MGVGCPSIKNTFKGLYLSKIVTPQSTVCPQDALKVLFRLLSNAHSEAKTGINTPTWLCFAHFMNIQQNCAVERS